MEESKCYRESIFVTLTYKEDKKDVSKEDLRKFIKDLREKCRKKENKYFRFYALGEYGTSTKRPHYHLVLFGLELEDIVIIEKTWKKGFVTVAGLNDARAMYITKYHVNRGDYPTDRQKSFTMMSNGLGKNYIQRMKKYHEQSSENQFYQLNQFKMSLPRYFREKLYTKGERATYSDRYRIKFEDEAKKAEQSNRKYFRLRQNQVESTNKKYKKKSNFNQKI